MAPLEGSFNLIVGGGSGPGQTGLGVPIVWSVTEHMRRNRWVGLMLEAVVHKRGVWTGESAYSET